MLHNIMEELVEQCLDSVLIKYDCCTCAKCRNDMMAIALNKLPSRYIVTSIGETISKTHYMLEMQGQTELLYAVVEAAEFVKANPRHESVPTPELPNLKG